ARTRLVHTALRRQDACQGEMMLRLVRLDRAQCLEGVVGAGVVPRQASIFRVAGELGCFVCAGASEYRASLEASALTLDLRVGEGTTPQKLEPLRLELRQRSVVDGLEVTGLPVALE